MSFDALLERGIDYMPCKYENSNVMFRCQRRNLYKPFVDFVGGTETYGKFIGRPFPDRVEDILDKVCVNFGCDNAGVDVFLNDPFLREVVSRAEVTVIQTLSPRNLSNRLYSVHPRRNDRFLRPSKLMGTIYDELDFADFNFTKHLLTHIHSAAPDQFDIVVEELQDTWRSRMRMLFGQIPGKTILLHIADPVAEHAAKPEGRDPWFLTRDMIDDFRPLASAVIELAPKPAGLAADTDGMVFSEMEADIAKTMLGSDAHAEIAQVVADTLKRIL